MRVWIDFSNSPHPLLFAPIARRLEELGHEVLVTVRDHAQTAELARASWPRFQLLGGPSPKGRSAKARTMASRIRALARWSRERRPDVALSHNSYAQIVAARATRVRVVTAMDYEFQPANQLAFRLAQRVVLPEALPTRAANRQGARPSKTRTYPGLKEELYIGEFDYEDGAAAGLGVDVGPDCVLVVARTPPDGALYHDFENVQFLEALEAIGRQSQVRCIALARNPQQRAAIERLRIPNLTVPSKTVDTRSLLYEADLVLGGGGTMTREAALMGVPTLSVFAGRVPAVDLLLEREGRLARLANLDQLQGLVPRDGQPVPREQLRSRGRKLVREFVGAAMTP